MLKDFDFNFIKDSKKRFLSWAGSHQRQLAVFNFIMMILVLLRSAGYFQPFLPITINLVVLSAFIVSIVLLDADSTFLFSSALVFWVIAFFFKVLKIDIWAERTAIYTFESLVLAVALLFFESLHTKKT